MLETRLETTLDTLLKKPPGLAGVTIYPGHSDDQKHDSTHIVVIASGYGGSTAYAGYPEVAVQARVQTQSDDDDMRVHARLVTALREILGHDSTTGPGPAALVALNATPGLGCSCYTVEAPTAEARDAPKRQHDLATPYRFWIHAK
jgi:hypothetical protein